MGSVVEHEMGWRAQYAYPKSFTPTIAMLPVCVSRLERQLNALVAYGCDIFISDQDETVPLWIKGFGYASAGLDQLVQRSQAWYDRLARERRIQEGDRLAVPGRGIAVVDYADQLEIRALLWNRSKIRVSRKDVVWDEQNIRWEASSRTCRLTYCNGGLEY